MELPSSIIDFYLTRSPHAHSDKGSSARSIDLGEFGWQKNELDKLMKWVVAQHSSPKASGICFCISKDARKTTKALSLDSLNPLALGGVFCINRNITVTETNAIRCKLTETYATCLFRHIRNSIAHANYEVTPKSGTVLFKDQISAMGTPDPALTAEFLTTIKLLEDFRIVIEKGPQALKDDVFLLTAPAYRIDRKLLGKTEEMED